jgi:hypothetical protein
MLEVELMLNTEFALDGLRSNSCCAIEDDGRDGDIIESVSRLVAGRSDACLSRSIAALYSFCCLFRIANAIFKACCSLTRTDSLLALYYKFHLQLTHWIVFNADPGGTRYLFYGFKLWVYWYTKYIQIP